MPIPIPRPDPFPSDSDAVPSFDDVLSGEAVLFLADRGVRRGLTTAFQSLLAAAVGSVAEAAGTVRAASASAINLAQQTHVAAVADDLDAVVAALRGGLSEQGLALMPGRRKPAVALRELVRPAHGWRPRLRPSEAPGPLPWGPAMTLATDALAEAAEYAATLAAAQPDRSSARILGEGVAARLERDRDVLVEEAARTGE